MKKYLVLLIMLVITAGTTVFASGDDSTKASTNLPSIMVKDINGAPVNFAEFAANGQITIVSFWATWCKPCILELNNIDAVYEEWQKKYNVRLIAVSVDDSRTMPKVKPLVTAKNWTYDILVDLNSDLRRALNVTNPPTTFLIDKSGKIVFTHTGYLEGDENELEEKIKELTGN